MISTLDIPNPYKAADLIFTHSDTLLGGLIRFFETRAGEEKTFTNHTAGLGPEARKVIEALLHVVETERQAWLANEQFFEIWRNITIDDELREAIALKAAGYIGRDYGWWKLLLHAGDGLISKVVPWDVYLFRRLQFADRYPYCSWIWAWSYAEFGIRFGCSPRRATPDDMHDYVKNSPAWELITERRSQP